ncbi:hypothetical protein Hanom_Chr13g01223671 [Helianthus anomalus]
MAVAALFCGIFERWVVTCDREKMKDEPGFYSPFKLWRERESKVRLSPMLRTSLDGLSCLVSCHITSLPILKNP